MELRGQRLPGLPFHPSIGRTFIEVTKDGARVKKESELRSVRQAASVLVNVSLIFDQVCQRIMEITKDERWHPVRVLDVAYPHDAAPVN